MFFTTNSRRPNESSKPLVASILCRLMPKVLIRVERLRHR